MVNFNIVLLNVFTNRVGQQGFLLHLTGNPRIRWSGFMKIPCLRITTWYLLPGGTTCNPNPRHLIGAHPLVIPFRSPIRAFELGLLGVSAPPPHPIPTTTFHCRWGSHQTLSHLWPWLSTAAPKTAFWIPSAWQAWTYPYTENQGKGGACHCCATRFNVVFLWIAGVRELPSGVNMS